MCCRRRVEAVEGRRYAGAAVWLQARHGRGARGTHLERQERLRFSQSGRALGLGRHARVHVRLDLAPLGACLVGLEVGFEVGVGFRVQLGLGLVIRVGIGVGAGSAWDRAGWGWGGGHG